MEHKGWDAPLRDLFVFWLLRLHFSRDAFQAKRIPVGMRHRFRRFFPSRRGLAVSLSGEGSHMAQRAIRFSEAMDKGIQEATEKRGFSSPTAFIRHAVEQELAGHAEQLATTEERLVAGIEQVKGEVIGLKRSQQALFALLDSLAKILLTCIPEPDIHALEAAVARAQGRHARLLKSAGQAMGGDSRLAMQELVKHGER